MSWRALGVSLLLTVMGISATSLAASRFAQTHSRSDYVHWIELYDADGRTIDPTDPKAKPYSPKKTCGRCHDYDAIACGYHFNALDKQVDPGRPGEPWIWTDTRTGTQIPMSYRDWKGVHNPDKLGISPWEFVLKFGRHLPGGGPGAPPEPTDDASTEPAEAAAAEPADEASAEPADDAAATAEEPADEDPSRWHLSGQLEIDCMFCHSNDTAYDREAWWNQIQEENFAWAPTAALALGKIDGDVSDLPDDFDPETADPEGRDQLPTTTYGALRTNGDGKIFFDVIRTPPNSVCYYCHNNRLVGKQIGPEWTHDEDVHVQAGMSCTDCHRNGIDHHTVRGYEGEKHPSVPGDEGENHPTGNPVATLSCRGCHMGDAEGAGRLGAPKPLHVGLPALHFEKLSCTACHSGPAPTDDNYHLQTALAHGLGLPEHYHDNDPPALVTPVMLQENGKLYPHRMMWPTFWGTVKDDKITPLNPEVSYDALRKTLRVRRGQTFTEVVNEAKLSTDDKIEALGEERAKVDEEAWTDKEKTKLAKIEKTRAAEAWQEKLGEALEALKEVAAESGAAPVFVSGGKAYRLADDGTVEAFDNDAAQHVSWKLAHDVRPARYSLGMKGCYDCHAEGTPIFEGTVTAAAPAPVEKPVKFAMHELAGYDKTRLDAWNLSFQGRTAFKWFGFAAMGVVGLILLSYLCVGVTTWFGTGRKG